jgi:L-fuconolactonase
MENRKLIDTHIHAWNLEKVHYQWLEGNTSALNKTYSLDELEPELEKLHVSHGVMVQAANSFEDSFFMLEECKNRNWLKGVVGWMPFTEPQHWEENLLKFEENPLLKGFRHLIHDEPNPKWLLQPEVLESFVKLEKSRFSFDVVSVLPEHLACVLKISEKYPEISWCLDHLSHPPTKANERFGKWGDLMKEAASNPKIHIKISGLGMTVNDLQTWNANEIQPYVEFGLEHFGIHRAMIGGDWPVVNLCGGYQKSIATYLEILQKNLSEKETDQILSKNAIRFYRLEV